MKEDLQQVRVRVGQVVGKDDDRLVGHRFHVFDADEDRARLEQPVREDMVNPPGERIGGVVVPVGAGIG